MNSGPKWYLSPPPIHAPHDPNLEGPPDGGPIRLAVGESIALRVVGVDERWRRLPVPAGSISWGAVSGGPVRLHDAASPVCRVEAVEKGETQIQVRAFGQVAHLAIVVGPSPIVGLAILPEPSDHSAGSYAYPGTNASLAWLRRREEGSTRLGPFTPNG